MANVHRKNGGGSTSKAGQDRERESAFGLDFCQSFWTRMYCEVGRRQFTSDAIIGGRNMASGAGRMDTNRGGSSGGIVVRSSTR